MYVCVCVYIYIHWLLFASWHTPHPLPGGLHEGSGWSVPAPTRKVDRLTAFRVEGCGLLAFSIITYNHAGAPLLLLLYSWYRSLSIKLSGTRV